MVCTGIILSLAFYKYPPCEDLWGKKKPISNFDISPNIWMLYKEAYNRNKQKRGECLIYKQKRGECLRYNIYESIKSIKNE